MTQITLFHDQIGAYQQEATVAGLRDVSWSLEKVVFVGAMCLAFVCVALGFALPVVNWLWF